VGLILLWPFREDGDLLTGDLLAIVTVSGMLKSWWPRWQMGLYLAVMLGMIAVSPLLDWREGTVGELVECHQHEHGILRVALSPDERFVLSSDVVGEIKLGPLDGSVPPRVFKSPPWTDPQVTLSPDGRQLLAIGSGFTFQVWDITTGKRIRGHSDFPDPDDHSPLITVGCAAFSSDSRFAITGASGPEELESRRVIGMIKGQVLPAETDTLLRLWSTESGQQIRTFAGHTAAIRAVAVAPDGRRIISASDDGTIRLWHVESGLQIRRIKGYRSRVLSIAFALDGEQALTGHEDGSVRLWNIDDETETLRLQRHRGEVTAVAFAADGQTMFSGGSDKSVRCWDANTGQALGVCRGGTIITSLAVSRDGSTVLVGGKDGSVKVWRR
jgi:WD40 repeat protein